MVIERFGAKLTKYLWYEYGLIKLGLTAACLFLLTKPIYQFLIKKPTITVPTKEDLRPEDVPVIIVCPDPKVNLTALTFLGYENLYVYKNGRLQYNDSYHVMSWNGRNQESVKNVFQNVSSLQSPEDCPDLGYISFSNSSEEKIEKFKFELTRAMFPNHMCCRSVTPDLKEAKSLKVLGIEFKKKKPYKSVNIYLSDQTSWSPFTVLGIDMTGNRINLNLKNHKTGYKFFKMSPAQNEHFEGDPNFPCVRYSQPGEYGSCIETELTEKVMQRMGCTAPWITDREV